MTMARFLGGVVASGAWAVFDEFNRIPADVLSIVATQVGQGKLGDCMKYRQKSARNEDDWKILVNSCMLNYN